MKINKWHDTDLANELIDKLICDMSYTMPEYGWIIEKYDPTDSDIARNIGQSEQYNEFYYYDDMSSKILKIGGYNKLLNHVSNPNVMTNGVLYFYTYSESVNILDKEKLINDIDESFVDFFKELDDENIDIDD